MAFMQCSFQSGALGKTCMMNVIVPQEGKAAPKGQPGPRKEYPVVYLLHGLSDDHTAWARWSSIERYARERGIVVVMPDGGRSFYADMDHGLKYWTFLADELPEIVHDLFPVSAERKDTFAAGLSMGGYGALKLGLNHPERFAGIGALSAVTDIVPKLTDPEFSYWHEEFAEIFGSGEKAIATGCDLYTVMQQAAKAPQKPRIVQFCGADDFLIKDNRKLRDAFLDLKWREYRYQEFPGVHSWEFWDTHIPEILDFLLER